MLIFPLRVQDKKYVSVATKLTPTQVIIMHNPRCVELMRECCVSTSKTDVLAVDFSHIEVDTTFSIGDYYVTTVSFMNIMLEVPTITPVFVAYHFNKDDAVFKEIFHEIQYVVGSAHLAQMIGVCDNEAAIMNNLRTYLKIVVPCRNHSKSNLVEWLKRKKVSKQILLKLWAN